MPRSNAVQPAMSHGTFEIELPPMTWARAMDMSLFIYAEGSKGKLTPNDEGMKEAHDTIMKAAVLADAVAHLVSVLQAFRWICSAYTGDGAKGVSPQCWCEGFGTGGQDTIDFDPEMAIVAIDDALGNLPRKGKA